MRPRLPRRARAGRRASAAEEALREHGLSRVLADWSRRGGLEGRRPLVRAPAVSWVQRADRAGSFRAQLVRPTLGGCAVDWSMKGAGSLAESAWHRNTRNVLVESKRQMFRRPEEADSRTTLRPIESSRNPVSSASVNAATRATTCPASTHRSFGNRPAGAGRRPQPFRSSTGSIWPASTGPVRALRDVTVGHVCSQEPAHHGRYSGGRRSFSRGGRTTMSQRAAMALMSRSAEGISWRNER